MRSNQVSLGDVRGLGIFAVMAKALALPPQQPDVFERPEASQSPPPPPRRGLLDRLDHWFWIREQRATEAYLAQSQDVHDLEARIRHLEHRALYRYY